MKRRSRSNSRSRDRLQFSSKDRESRELKSEAQAVGRRRSASRGGDFTNLKSASTKHASSSSELPVTAKASRRTSSQIKTRSRARSSSLSSERKRRQNGLLNPEKIKSKRSSHKRKRRGKKSSGMKCHFFRWFLWISVFAAGYYKLSYSFEEVLNTSFVEHDKVDGPDNQGPSDYGTKNLGQGSSYQKTSNIVQGEPHHSVMPVSEKPQNAKVDIGNINETAACAISGIEYSSDLSVLFFSGYEYFTSSMSPEIGILECKGCSTDLVNSAKCLLKSKESDEEYSLDDRNINHEDYFCIFQKGFEFVNTENTDLPSMVKVVSLDCKQYLGTSTPPCRLSFIIESEFDWFMILDIIGTVCFMLILVVFSRRVFVKVKERQMLRRSNIASIDSNKGNSDMHSPGYATRSSFKMANSDDDSSSDGSDVSESSHKIAEEKFDILPDEAIKEKRRDSPVRKEKKMDIESLRNKKILTEDEVELLRSKGLLNGKRVSRLNIRESSSRFSASEVGQEKPGGE